MVLFAACLRTPINLDFTSQVISLAEDHAVSIVTVYTMGEQEYQTRLKQIKALPTPCKRYLLQVIDMSRGQERAIAYIGAGGLLANNYVLSVRHLFDEAQNTTSMKIWVFLRGLDHCVSAKLVAKTAGKEFHDDYALIRLNEDVKRPGLKLAESDVADGTPIIFIGSTGGTAWHTRFGRASRADKFFQHDENGVLHLTPWEETTMLMTYPGGAGDSGGIVVGPDGRIVGIMYCGLEIRHTEYVFSNPIQMVWDFLKAIGYEKNA